MKSRITDDTDHCYICGRYGTEEHHVLHGSSNRKNADKYGLTVGLCRECHTRLHDKGFHDRDLMWIGQQTFEKEYSREEFVRIFGKSYEP